MKDTPSDPYGFCESMVREEDRDAWLACLFAPSSLRPHLHALEAFRLELGHVRGRVTQPIAGEIRLQWWRDAIFGEARGDPSANPIAAALSDTIARRDLPRDILDDAIEAHRIALYGEPVPTLQDLEQRFDATHGGFIRLASIVLAGRAGDHAVTAHHAGAALGIEALLRNFSADAQRGWSAIPADVLRRHGGGQGGLSTDVATAAIAASLAELASGARGHLASLRDRQSSISVAARPAYLRVALVETALRLWERPGLDPFAPPPHLPQWRRQWHLWRASRTFG